MSASPAASAPRRVGFFGGTFNPIHYAHLRIAEEVGDIAGLDEIMFVPSGTPPHRDKPQVSAQQRLEMVRLAIADNPRFTLSSIEVDDREHQCNYTFDTLSALKQRHPEVQFSLICGSDVQSQKWYRFDAILEMLEALYVVYRPGDDAEGMAAAVRRHAGGDERLFAKYHWVQTEGLTVSSTLIRSLVRERRSLRYLLPDAVAEYIHKHSLYGELRS
ncbi:MAG: nicotinate (nicotinamide) nucleotide adenylyltransferase [bacterium]|nr:nicotinate (nicotinamide) nucleotide adenylyltransferase [bacterium]